MGVFTKASHMGRGNVFARLPLHRRTLAFVGTTARLFRGLMAMWLFVAGWADAVAASGAEDVDADQTPTREELANIRVRSTALLKDIVPAAQASPSIPDLAKRLQSDEGTVRWGHLFGGAETSALVNVPVKHPPDPTELPETPPSEYLSFYTWSKGRWVYRQFVGEASALSLHQHQGRWYLQGSHRSGRHDGEHFSWTYDGGRRRLIPTHLEDWGPIYLTGPYVVCTRGFERLAHWDTKWVYDYHHGRKGPLLACLHTDDQGRFTVTCRDAGRSPLKSWSFQPESEDSDVYFVSPNRAPDEFASDRKGEAKLSVTFLNSGRAGSSEIDGVPEYCFQLLSGLNPHLLEEKWRDQLPKPPTLRRAKIGARGNPGMMARFQQAQR